MTLIKYIRKLEQIDFLISCECTGSPDVFANKLGIKRSTLFTYLKDLKMLGVEIKFSYVKQTYYYKSENRISTMFQGAPIESIDLENTKAGSKTGVYLTTSIYALWPKIVCI